MTLDIEVGRTADADYPACIWLDVAFRMGWLLTETASFANWCGLAVAGSIPVMTVGDRP
jgi:hypothetical protein